MTISIDDALDMLRPLKGPVWSMLGPDDGTDPTSIIRNFLDPADPRPAREQLQAKYAHGWRPEGGFTMDPAGRVLTYPDDPPYQPVAVSLIRDEIVLLYEFAIVAIAQPDGTFEVARME